MPVFYPDNVQTNSPSINPIVLGSSNHISGFGFFDSIGSGNTNRNDIGSSFRAPGYLAVVYDSTSVADSEMYVYASTNLTDGAWTTTSNWKSFEGAANTNLGANDLTQTASTNRNYDIADGRGLFFNLSGGQTLFELSDDDVAIKTGSGIDIRLLDSGGGEYVALSAPTAVSANYTLTFPNAVAGADRLIQSNSSGDLSYAELSFSSDTLVVGAQSVDISAVNTNTNLATTNLTQSQSNRSYTLEVSDALDFETSGSGQFRIQDSGGEMIVTVQGSESSHIGVSGGASKVFGFTPNASQAGNIILKAPPGYTEGGIWYNESNQIKFATPTFDSPTSQLVIGTNSVDISGVNTNTNLATTDLTQSDSEREYQIGATSLTFQTDTQDLLTLTPSTIELGSGIPLRLKDDAGGQYVGLDVPSSVTSYTLTLPNGVATAARVLESNSSGNLSYAELSIATNTLTLGNQSVVLPSGGSGDNLSTANLTQTDATRTYDIGNGTLSFTEGGDEIVKIDSTPAGTFAGPYLTTFRGFQTFEPQTAGGGLLLDIDTDYLTQGRFWGEVVELAPENSAFSVGQVVTFNGSNALTTAINSDATRSSGAMFMAVTASATKKVMTRGYICLSTSAIDGLSGNNDTGSALYVDSTAGKMTITTPSSGAYMRLVGHLILVSQGSTAVVVYFNPEGSVFKTI